MTYCLNMKSILEAIVRTRKFSRNIACITLKSFSAVDKDVVPWVTRFRGNYGAHQHKQETKTWTT